MTALKAYSVLENDERTGGIRFARHAITAAVAGANEHGGDLSDIECRRAAWADQYAKTGVPARVAVEHGWNFECHGCNRRIDDEEMEARNLPLADICGLLDGRVYCSPRCKWRSMKKEARRKAEEQSAIEDFKKIVLARFPDADFQVSQDNFRGHHAYVIRPFGTGHWHRQQVIVAFRFPGMQIGPATFRMDADNGRIPANAHYYCCSGDREAFEVWAGIKMEGSPHV